MSLLHGPRRGNLGIKMEIFMELVKPIPAHYLYQKRISKNSPNLCNNIGQ